ncbi:hypothetical protein K461DRAFT_296520 [Myriangium duriaei CBS 260.36]|uniref:Uncharacterized protein n=1 Tax=Myriangium duriaei CBS 260.36 TaxID=1168546 RepID=A0A9P4IUC9_9PEZI|nr:hypothetical protein K461DRAFT_296520 [Myriangium duriaei CBS 260.36]
MSDGPETALSPLELSCQQYSDALLPKVTFQTWARPWPSIRKLLEQEKGDETVTGDMVETTARYLLIAEFRRLGIQCYRICGGTKAMRVEKLKHFYHQLENQSQKVTYYVYDKTVTVLAFSRQLSEYPPRQMMELAHAILIDEAQRIEISSPFMEEMMSFETSSGQLTITVSPKAFWSDIHRSNPFPTGVHDSLLWVLESHHMPDTTIYWPGDGLLLLYRIHPSLEFGGVRNLTLSGMPRFLKEQSVACRGQSDVLDTIERSCVERLFLEYTVVCKGCVNNIRKRLGYLDVVCKDVRVEACGDLHDESFAMREFADYLTPV